jgi:hypothetical protein
MESPKLLASELAAYNDDELDRYLEENKRLEDSQSLRFHWTTLHH